MVDLGELTSAVETGNPAAARAITSAALDAGIDPEAVLSAMTTAMDRVGARFAANECYVPEMLISARAMKEGMAVLEPVLVAGGHQPDHIAVIGTIAGDLHDIGKNLVAMSLRGANVGVVDIGTNADASAFINAARDHGAGLIGISALLTTTMVGMRDVVASIRASDLENVKVIVGGAPVTSEFAAEVGADGYAPDAASAVAVARGLLGG